MQQLVQCSKSVQLLDENYALKREIRAAIPRLRFVDYALMVSVNCQDYSLCRHSRDWEFNQLSDKLWLCLGDPVTQVELCKLNDARCHWKFRCWDGIVGKYGLESLLDSLRALSLELPEASRAALHQFLGAAAQLL